MAVLERTSAVRNAEPRGQHSLQCGFCSCGAPMIKQLLSAAILTLAATQAWAGDDLRRYGRIGDEFRRGDGRQRQSGR